ncbi:hypothetical protein FZC75_13395 [Sutcliffiella horikoshii]|uniref:Uncharacterized protein n=1 Tax=Sutcliffiella horikoshii TaxID=79883 RepID=A0A5D4T7C4_9BACI|nr:hypothetical protein FZC75_13395 [Sutcliffiella horikoshii]
MLGAKGVDSSGRVATLLRPRRLAEEAQGRPLDKRSHLRRASAVSKYLNTKKPIPPVKEGTSLYAVPP